VANKVMVAYAEISRFGMIRNGIFNLQV
jgi:hypothetical protein